MPNENPNPPDPWPRRSLQAAKRAAIGALFFLILQIPRIRRLRRRVWVWTVVRILAVMAGGWLTWRFGFTELRAGYVLCAVALILFATFVRARPPVKSLDEKAREFGALVTLNGGKFALANDIGSPEEVHIFAGADRLLVVNHRDLVLNEIPLPAVKRISAQAVVRAGSPSAEGVPWELTVTWDAGTPQVARFRFEGFFAEHLAGVGAATLQGLLRKDLTVLPS